MKNAGNNFRVKVTENGPYIASGGIPLSEQSVRVDKDEQCHGWKEEKKISSSGKLCSLPMRTFSKQTILRWQPYESSF